MATFLTKLQLSDIDEPALGRQKRIVSVWQIYFEVLAFLMNSIEKRFEQQDYKRYIILEKTIFKMGNVDELEIILINYSGFQIEEFSL